jgi:hypothetical protein
LLQEPAVAERAAVVRTMTCLGFDWRAEISLKETLALLRGKTRDVWHYSDELSADVVAYDTQSALAQALVRRAQAESAAQVFFPSTSQDEDSLTLRYPFGASRLISCLDQASNQLAGHAAQREVANEPSLCQSLFNALHTPDAAAIVLRAADQHGWIRLPDRQMHWSQALDVDAIAALLSGTVQVGIVRVDERVRLGDLDRSAPVPVQAEALLWAIGITRSKSTLLQQLDAGSIYRLRRWPDFGVIGRRSQDLRCTSLLTQRPLAPTQLALLAGIPLGAIGSYLNACALCGLLDRPDLPAQPVAPLPAHIHTNESALGGVLRRIRLAFAFE